MQVRRLLLGAGLLGIMSATLSAAAISGTYNMSGIVTVTGSTITWQTDAPGNAADLFTLTGATGSFTPFNNTQQTIDNLNIVAEPVGQTFAPVPFMVIGGLPTLNINMIYQGTGDQNQCTAAPTEPQNCTPNQFAVGGKSPFTFTNNPPPNNIQSTGTFTFSGVTSDNQSSWFAIFTTQFNTPFQTVLAAFGQGGSGQVTNSYSATTTVVVTPLPEPAPIGMLGAGLTLLALWRVGYKRIRARR